MLLARIGSVGLVHDAFSAATLASLTAGLDGCADEFLEVGEHRICAANAD